MRISGQKIGYTMRYLTTLSVLALAACSSESSSYEINGVSVSKAEYDAYIGTTNPPSSRPTADQDLVELEGDLSDFDPVFGDIADRLNYVEAAGLDTKSNSSYTAIPANGTASFEGVIVAHTSGTPLLDYWTTAETEVSVDFARDTLTAENGQFVLLDANLQPIETLNGDLSITDGSIRGTRPNSVEMSVSGTLTGENNTMFISGDLTGSFKGTPVLGLTAGTNRATGIVNGVGAVETVIAIEALSTD